MSHLRTVWALATVLVVPLCGWAGDDPVQAPKTKADDPLADIPKLEPVNPPPREVIEASLERGIQFLLVDQNKDGSWGSAERTKGLNIYAPAPGAHDAFRAAVTSLCIAALIEMKDDRKEVQSAIGRGEDWLLANLGKVRRATGDAIYNVWAHLYSIQALAMMSVRHAGDADKLKEIGDLIALQYDLMKRYESVDGGWGYYDFRAQTQKPSSDSISFVDAAALIAFHEAKEAGYEPPAKIVKRAIAALKRQQLPDGSFLYGEYLKWQPRRGINRPGGSLGRSQACNLALRLWGDKGITNDVVKAWQHRLYARNGWLDIGRKRPIPHESWMQVAGYFYYFGHYYAAKSYYLLSPSEQSEFQAHMAHLMLDRQEKDGSWWDYPFYNYHQQYGTAFVLMTLKRCLPDPSE